MAISRSRAQFMKALSEEIQSDPKPLNDFERGFMKDQIERFDKYKGDMFLSAKQWAIISRVGTEKYNMEEPDESED